MRWAGATWYGPGLYGNSTACGQVLRPQTIGVAHRNLPCGTAVKFVYRGRAIVTRVIDRGPYSVGQRLGPDQAAARALGFDQVGADRSASRSRSSTREAPDAKRHAPLTAVAAASLSRSSGTFLREERAMSRSSA